MQFRILGEAIVEAEQAIEWYQARNVEAALGFRIALEGAIKSITNQPEFYQLVDDRFRECLIPSFPYAIYFEASANQVTVFAVSHTARKPGYWRGRS